MIRWLPLWLLPQLVWAAPFTLVWTFPRQYTPQPDQFVMSYTNQAGDALAEMATAPSAVGACAMVPDATEDTYCTVWPSCPPAGVVVFYVQAQWPDEASEQSNILTCFFSTAEPCLCHDPTTYTPSGGVMVEEIPPLPPGEIAPITKVTIPAPAPFALQYPPAPT